jgi:hypothetical protein
LDLLHPTLAHAGDGSGFVTPGTPSAGEKVVDPALNFPSGFWNGGVIWISASQTNPVAWWAQTQRIRASGPGFVEFDTLPIDAADPHPTRVPGPGNGYFLTGRLEVLDSATEWFHDAAASRLYIWTPGGGDPAQHAVDAKVREFAFDLTSLAYIEVADFNIFAATITMKDANHCTVDHVNVKYVSHFRELLPNTWGLNYDRAIDRSLWTLAGIGYSGIIMTGNDNQLLNSKIAYSACNGVVAWGANLRVENNLIHDINYLASSNNAIRTRGPGLVVSRNTAYNAGRDIVGMSYVTAGRIDFNHFYNAMLMTSDGGVLYTNRNNAQGTVIAYNHIHDNLGFGNNVGVYLDNSAGGYRVHHNVIWNITNGVGIQTYPHSFTDTSGTVYTGDHNEFYNNSFYNNIYDLLLTNGVGGPPVEPTTIKIINNVSTSGMDTQGVVSSNNLTPPTNPRYVNPSLADFHLQATSPAIDTGQVIPGITDGYAGSAPDKGTYETGVATWVPGHSGVSWAEPFPYPTVAGAPPTIITQPASRTVTQGQTATFTVTMTGSAPLSYQWQKNGVDISGATGASYTTPATTLADNGSTFRVVVTNGAGSTTSQNATLKVNAAPPTPPTITTQPTSLTVRVGETATFTVVASGTAPLSYQWQKSNVNIPGATSASYTTPPVTTADNKDKFRVIVSNAVGSVTSQTATLTVKRR